MRQLFLYIVLSWVMIGCSSDDDPVTTSTFNYTVSGSTTATVSGDMTAFGTSGGEFFVRLETDQDELILKVLLDPLVPGSYAVNPIVVNGTPQPIMTEDSFGELRLGTVFSGSQKFFDTAGGGGGSVTITSADDNMVRGTFQVAMRELVGGVPGTEPQITVTGSFTARK